MARRVSLIKTMAVFILTLFVFNVSPAQAAVSGKIQSINPMPDGRLEVVVREGEKSTRYVVNRNTQITAFVTAADVRSGARVYIVELPRESGGGAAGTEKGGFKSPFSNIAPAMRKKLGLPEIPSVPGVPSTQNLVPQVPGAPKLPEIPKPPQIPQAPSAKNPVPQQSVEAEAPAENQPKTRSKVKPPEAEPTEEEKTLYGRVDSGNALLPKGGEGLTTQPEKTVTRVRRVKTGIQLSLKNLQGKKEKTVLDSKHPVLERLSPEDLAPNMTVQIESAGKGQEILRMKVVG